MTSDRQGHTDQLYLLLEDLASREEGPRRLRKCTASTGWPRQGVYFFYEDGEVRADGSNRIVRVGTHALTVTSRTTLWARLRQHRGRLGGRNAGGGNHRASIFRGHVGTALIQRGAWPDGLLGAWTGRSRIPAWSDIEDQVERQVSSHIGAMPFLWLAVPSRPGGESDRGYIERHSIALLSGLDARADRPSVGWLGCYASSSRVRRSGLWNSNHVGDGYDPGFLQVLGDLVQRMGP
jgi:hypothetical protein